MTIVVQTGFPIASSDTAPPDTTETVGSQRNRKHVRALAPVLPVNFRARDYRPRAIEEDTDYGFQILESYLRGLGCVDGSFTPLASLRVLEIGPGHSLATAMLLACAGADVTVLDRFPPRWVPTYHARVVRALAERVAASRPDLDLRPLLSVLRANDFPPDVVRILPRAVDDPDLDAGPFDVVLSNACLEHVIDVPRTTRNLARITAPGGLGLHQIDLRDHRDFSRPLEYLTLSIAERDQLMVETSAECGNGWRRSEFEREMTRNGFEVLRFRTTETASNAYMTDVRARLHADAAHLSDADLSCLSGQFLVRLTPTHEPATTPPNRVVQACTVPPLRGPQLLSALGWTRLRLARAWDRFGLRAHAGHALRRCVRFVSRLTRRAGRGVLLVLQSMSRMVGLARPVDRSADRDTRSE